MFHIKFSIKLFLLLSLGFFIFTIIGTVTHEYGHYLLAKSLGYSSRVSYGYTTWEDVKSRRLLDSIHYLFSKEIEAKQDFPGKKEFEQIQKRHRRDEFLITLGGPLQTILTGSLGLFLLMYQRKKIVKAKFLNAYQWAIIFLSLFWLRQLANFIVGLLIFLLHGKFPNRGDEFHLSRQFNFPHETFGLITASIALMITLFIIFKIIPSAKQLTFITAGLFGGIIGYNFWLFWFGPIIMP